MHCRLSVHRLMKYFSPHSYRVFRGKTLKPFPFEAILEKNHGVIALWRCMK